ncbi:MAG: 50S ribosomal protein L11 methyltransferase [Deltaproteobacteria bacterium]|nr:50S ribosomal protein L11 methyltransferase [Deltaproteobacteria bacterium]
MRAKTWIEVRFLVPTRMQEEASLFLTDFSGRGVILEEGPDSDGVVVRAFFRPEEFGPWQQDQLQEYLKRLSSYELYPLGLEIRQAAEEDWAEAWKRHFKPVKVTPRLVIRPPWEEYRPAAHEVVITIYPGMAFGTGRHPTTILCLKALEEILAGGNLPAGESVWQVLDVGTGTGILALAAARLGARVLAIDVDPEAVAAALENVRLNALEDAVLVEDTPLDKLRQRFPLILANLTAHDLRQFAESLAGRLTSGGTLIASGFLNEDLPGLLDRFAASGLRRGCLPNRIGWLWCSGGPDRQGSADTGNHPKARKTASRRALTSLP